MVLSNEEIEGILDIEECMDILEGLYRDIYQDEALFMPRIDNMLPCEHPGAYYAFKHMGGGWPRHKIMALRINSDVVTHPVVEGRQRRKKLPLANGRWTGLVQLYDTESGALVALFPDGVVQRMRVGAANGLAIKYLARQDARRAALIGSGWQAGTQLMALLAARPIEQVKVFSLRQDNRESFASQMQARTGANITAADSLEDCVDSADIILAATSSLDPVIKPEWLRKGMHISCIKSQEVDRNVLDRCDRIVVHTAAQTKQSDNVLPGTANMPQSHSKGWWNDSHAEGDNFPDLASVIAGATPPRSSDEEITCFVNNIGLGLAFAAMGALVLKRARGVGLGYDLPSDWFSENVHP